MTGQQDDPSEQTQTEDLNKLCEVLGIGKDQALQLYQENERDVMKAIEAMTSKQENTLRDSYAAEGPWNAPPLPPKTSQHSSRVEKADEKASIIDLTTAEDPDDEIQRAIALSLQDANELAGAALSREDQDLSRAVEASMADSKEGSTRRRQYDSLLLHIDPLNPHERIRDGVNPVGIKNVGNTCWFSAVVQSLFHLPVFRNLVLGCAGLNVEPEMSPAVAFVRELRDLFALLLGSQRKYVDPTKAVQKLKSTFASSASSLSYQQDVSEFNHLLMDWLEKAFAGDPPTPNPILKLFYGKFATWGTNEGKSFSTNEPFGAYPLPVRGFPDVHSCLAGSMVQREIEPVSGTGSDAKSELETWFSHLPPVLILELSRFEFNAIQGKTVKIHDRVAFEEILYMDRYMESNKEVSRAKRLEEYKLKEQLAVLEQQLEKYTNYKGKRVALKDVLDLSLEFVESKRSRFESDESQDESMQISPQGGEDGSTKVGCVNEPSPRHVDGEEMRALKGCLSRWGDEVREDEEGLIHDVDDVKAQIDGLFKSPEFQKVCYFLHSVLVHEGQATGGHYWAYIRDFATRAWLKFNDVSVTSVTWEEIERESFGTHLTASAYCLFYINEKEADSIACKGEEFALPEALRMLVKEHNEKFRKEIDDFDAAARPTDAEAMSQSETLVSETCETIASGTGSKSLAENIDSEFAAISEELKIWAAKSARESSGYTDTRLEHILCYLESAVVPSPVRMHALVQETCNQFPVQKYPSECQDEVKRILRSKLDESPEEAIRGLENWQKAYSQFQEVYAHLTHALELLQDKRFSQALPFIIQATILNNEISEVSDYSCSVSKDMLGYLLRKGIKELNDACCEKLLSGDVLSGMQAYTDMCELVVPSLCVLDQHWAEENVDLREHVNQRWCDLLTLSLEDNVHHRLEEILEKLLDSSMFRDWKGIRCDSSAINRLDVSRRFVNLIDGVM